MAAHARAQLLAESRLLAPEQCQQLAADFGQLKGAPTDGSAKPLAQWLVTRTVSHALISNTLKLASPVKSIFASEK